ncbi:MAG: ThuA domain-containing protein [Draconibacterium sp.]|nr:ThuA domain-containing protein [Draconibacterium sp.]
MIFKNIYSRLLVTVMALTLIVSCTSTKKDNTNVENARIKALIVNGQMNNSHENKAMSEALETMLEITGEFNVEFATSPKKGKDMSTFKPNFKDYDVVILDYDGDEWPEETKNNFVEYVKTGGGVVVVHSANNAFPDWKEYNEIIGLGGWGNRNEKHGPYVYWENGEIVRIDTAGVGGSHGDRVPVLVETRNAEHPIMKGLPPSWLHNRDELYGNLRGPGKNIDFLATAYSDSKTGGTGKHEPVLFTIKYGEGRVFHTVLGHVSGRGPQPAIQCAGFIVTLQRGAEWAATGEVLQDVPVEFPNYASFLLWEDYRPPTLDETFEEIIDYEIGDSKRPFSTLSAHIRNSDQKSKTLRMYESKMIEILESNAKADAKNEICRILSIWGSKKSVSTLEKLKSDNKCAEMAKYALARIQG